MHGATGEKKRKSRLANWWPHLEIVLVEVLQAESLGPELEVVRPPVVDADEGDLGGVLEAELSPRPPRGLGQRDFGVTLELRPEAEGLQTLLSVLLVELSPALKVERAQRVRDERQKTENMTRGWGKSLRLSDRI